MGLTHLPPGRKAGPQSRRDRLLFPLGIAVAMLLFVPPFTLLAVEKATDGRLAIDDLGVLIPFVLVGGAFYELRRRSPARARALRVSASPGDVRRGDQTVAALTIDREGQVAAERVELGLVCVERYDEYARRGETHWPGWPVTRQEIIYEDWYEVDFRRRGHELRLEVPNDLPYSYEGRRLSYAWRVSAREVRGRREDRFAHHPIWVLP